MILVFLILREKNVTQTSCLMQTFNGIKRMQILQARYSRTTNLELNFELCKRYQNLAIPALYNNTNQDHIWHSRAQRSDPSDNPRRPGLRIYGIP